MHWLNVYVIIFMGGLAFSLVFTPFFMKIAKLLKFYDIPEDQAHKSHETPIPLMGGMAMLCSWLALIVAGLLLSRTVPAGKLGKDVLGYLPGVTAVSRELFFLCLAACMATFLGLYDDVKNMSAKAKLGGQFAVAATAVSFGGVEIGLVSGIPVLSWACAVLWIILVMNAINFFDNMDGLAAGTATIALCFFTITAVIQEQFFVATLGAATAGVALGFWFFNQSPALVFMGDSGSHFLGFNLAVLGAMVTFYRPEKTEHLFPVLIPLFILAIPLFDAAAVMFLRLRKGKPVYIGDNNHISHRFVRMGMSRRRAVFMVHLMVLSIALGVLPLIWGDMKTAIVAILQALTILILVSFLQCSNQKIS